MLCMRHWMRYPIVDLAPVYDKESERQDYVGTWQQLVVGKGA